MSNRQGVFFVGTRGPISGSASRVPGESIVKTVSTRIIGHCTGRLRLTSGWVSTRTSNRTRKKYKVPSFEAMPQAFNHGLRMVPSVSLQNRVHPNPQIQGLQSHRYRLFDMKDLSIQHLLCGLSVGIALSQCKDARDLTDLLSRRGLTACMQTS